MFLAAGQKLDKYEIVAPLAVGGMAELYVARSRGIASFEKLCVLKRILPQFARDEEFVQMFLDEARLAATLHHPNVIQVYDIGVSDGLYYFTMEYVHGEDLAAIVAAARNVGRGMKLEHAVAIVAAVAEGLHHAHEQRGPDGSALDIVHRDVSPTNILVSYDGNIKVVDFGIAKAAARNRQTTAGGAKGKLSYMSPEQVRADRHLDRRSDVFSLGIVLYELTTGRALFRGDSDYLIAEQIVSGTIAPPRSVRATYPEALEQIVMRALARDPDHRFATARDMQLALEEFARAEQLRLSSVGLSDYMSSLFPDQVRAWEAARREGRSIVEYVTAMLATRMASSRATAAEPSWWRRWAPAIALVGVAAAIAGWIVVFQQRGRTDAPAANGANGANETATAPARPDAAPAPPAVPRSDAAITTAAIDDASNTLTSSADAGAADARGIPATSPGRKPDRRRPPPQRAPDAGAPPIVVETPPIVIDAGVARPDGLDDRLNPFKPPGSR